jgi:hypothetical protein
MTQRRNALDRYMVPSHWGAIQHRIEANEDGSAALRSKLASVHERSPPL